ncbi:MAG TPA: DUF4386 family protein [Symbiobacteriaceae bacterium]|jgi:hypothetical protein
MDQSHAETVDSRWKSLYKVGATTALIVVLVSLLDVILTFLPGSRSVIDWFTLFQQNRFLGLRDLGLLNVITNAFTVPMVFALYVVHRRANPAYAALAAILFFMGATIYIANNTAFPMLTLSDQYSAATIASQKSLFVAVGQALLAREDLTAGAFMGFFFGEVGQIILAVVMLRSRIFSKWTAWAGLAGFGLLLVFNICAAFAPAIYAVAMLLGVGGGLLVMAYYCLIAQRLFQPIRMEGVHHAGTDAPYICR